MWGVVSLLLRVWRCGPAGPALRLSGRRPVGRWGGPSGSGALGRSGCAAVAVAVAVAGWLWLAGCGWLWVAVPGWGWLWVAVAGWLCLGGCLCLGGRVALSLCGARWLLDVASGAVGGWETR